MAGTEIRTQVSVVKATKDTSIAQWGQVKDLVNRFNKETCRVASVGELVGAYADNVLTLTGGVTKIDNVTLATGDRVLLKDQLDHTQNGIYTVTDLGTAGTASSATGTTTSTTITDVTVDVTAYETAYTASETFTYTDATTSWEDNSSNTVDLATIGIAITGTPTDADTITITYTAATPGTGGVLTRAVDFAESAVIMNNTTVAVAEGTSNADTKWIIVSDGVLTVGTASIIFTKDAGECGFKKAHGTFVGDGTTTEFAVVHNFNLTNAYAYQLVVKGIDNSKQEGVKDIIVKNNPTTGAEANSITLEFDNAPSATETFDAYISCLE